MIGAKPAGALEPGDTVLARLPAYAAGPTTRYAELPVLAVSRARGLVYVHHANATVSRYQPGDLVRVRTPMP